MLLRSLILTGEQIRAARALGRIEQTELARLSGLSLETIKRLERIRGPVDANVRTLNAICAAFETLGIVFDGGGVAVLRSGPGADVVPLAPGGRSGPHPPIQILQRLIYASTSALPPEAAMQEALADILRCARSRNGQLQVTGALLVSHGRFLQVLEGPKDAVHRIFGAISSDPRHTNIRVVENRAVGARLFSEWSMCCGVIAYAGEGTLREPALREGFDPQSITAATAIGLLCIVRDVQASSARSAAGADCPVAQECLSQSCVQSNHCSAA